MSLDKHSLDFITESTNKSIEQLKANQDKIFMQLVSKVTPITKSKEFAEAISKRVYSIEKLHILNEVGNTNSMDMMLLFDNKGIYLGSIITKLYLADNTGNTVRFDQGVWEHIPNNRILKLKDVVENPNIILSLINFS